MPIQANFLERTAFFSLNMAPSPILDLAGMFAFQVLSVAIQQGMFQALSKHPLTATKCEITATLCHSPQTRRAGGDT
jgi:hypothetical protein